MDVPSRVGFESEYPFASHTLDLGGQTYHYVDEGQGPPLLFVHGNPTWSFAWRNLIREFSSTHRCIAVDHIGCGFSSKPQTYDYRLRQHATNVETLIQKLDLRDITLVAHDWGGAIGTLAASGQIDRFARVVLMNTGAFRAPHIPFRIAVCRWPVLGPLGVRGFNLFARAALSMATEKPGLWTSAMRSGYLAPYNNWANRVAIQRFVEDIPMSAAHPSYADLVTLEERLALFARMPILLFWGMRDWCFTPWFLDQFIQRWPHAQVQRQPDAGHYVFEDAKDELIAAIRKFLGPA